jgi:transcriptional regulator GlxA family with amidase domain
VRVDAARQYLGDVNVRIETAAVNAGFGDSEHMRKAFIRNLGITPFEYRARFGPADQQPVPVVTEKFMSELKDKWSDF